MSAHYDKIIVIEKDEEKKAVIIFDDKLHIPITYGLVKYGMDDLLDLHNRGLELPK